MGCDLARIGVEAMSWAVRCELHPAVRAGYRYSFFVQTHFGLNDRVLI